MIDDDLAPAVAVLDAFRLSEREAVHRVWPWLRARWFGRDRHGSRFLGRDHGRRLRAFTDSVDGRHRIGCAGPNNARPSQNIPIHFFHEKLLLVDAVFRDA